MQLKLNKPICQIDMCLNTAKKQLWKWTVIHEEEEEEEEEEVEAENGWVDCRKKMSSNHNLLKKITTIKKCDMWLYSDY